MRRLIILGTAALVLAGAAVTAYAASSDFNSYTASLSFSPNHAGTKGKPSAYAWHQMWTASGNNGNQAAPLTRIVTKIYGTVSNGKDFPVCTAAMINNAGNAGGWNKVCPKGSIVAQGPVESLFVGSSTPTVTGTPCNPYLYIYNGGQGTQVDFFTEYPFAPGTQYTCVGGAVMTGAAGAYNVGMSEQGGSLVINAVLPADVSTAAGGLTAVYASLIKYDLTYAKLTKKVHGKTVGYTQSVACKAGKRPYSTTFYAQNYQGQTPATQTTTIAGSLKC